MGILHCKQLRHLQLHKTEENYTAAIILSLALALKNSDGAKRGLSAWILTGVVWSWIASTALPPSTVTTMANLIFFAGIILLLYVGYLEQMAFCINLGLIAFAGLVIARYLDFAWQYMERSTAFIVGGLLLLLMGFGLEKGRRKFLKRDQAE